MTRVGLLSQILHVHSNEHLSQFDEITVILIFHCKTQSRVMEMECNMEYVAFIKVKVAGNGINQNLDYLL